MPCTGFRRWLAVLTAAVFAAAFAGQALAALPDTVARVKKSVVAVGTVEPTRRPPARVSATGFVVADGRHALTNLHVLPERATNPHRTEYLAVFSGVGSNADVRQAQVIARDKEHDLALLRFSGAVLPSLELANSDRVREGETYAFTGFPIGMALGMHAVTHTGIISAITPIVIPANTAAQLDATRIHRLRSPYDVFQLDATAYPGNSGSPLYDGDSGNVIGIVNKVFVKETKESMLQKPSGISYAIPIKYAKRLLKEAGLGR